MWRQEDVFYALGGGIDAYTGVPVDDEYTLAEKAGASAAPLVSLCIPPLMHGAAQWGTCASCSRATPWCSSPGSTPMRSGRSIERHRVQTHHHHRRRHGPTAHRGARRRARPLGRLVPVRRGLERARCSAPPSRPASSSGSPASSWSTPSAPPRPATTAWPRSVSTTPSARASGVTVKGYEGSVVLDDELHPVVPGSGVVGMLARGGHIPFGYYKDDGEDRRDVPDRGERRPLRHPRRLRDASRPTAPSRCSAAARCASTPAARRSTPRRSKVR